MSSYEKFKNKLGYSIGIVSTVQFCNATPAAFASHNKNRNNYIEISYEIITKTKPDVVIGGGHPQWSAGYRYLSGQDYNTLKNSDEYIFTERIKGINGSVTIREAAKKAVMRNKKLFGLFGGQRGYFENPVPRHNPGHPQFDIESENPLLLSLLITATAL
ncbi:MAG: alkaline phosphatase [Spirochaetes bacterium]|nr:alkaline phosphatase [Spirochaetota bacterium]